MPFMPEEIAKIFTPEWEARQAEIVEFLGGKPRYSPIHVHADRCDYKVGDIVVIDGKKHIVTKVLESSDE